MSEGNSNNNENKKKFANRLINSKTPYLRQHAHNFVDWYFWGDEAFNKAKKENKPIFLSIGYSTCHWCHVMAHESFDDKETASLLNKFFINIKLDREERPDLDNQFMNVCIMMNQRGGWPLTIILTPDLKPFFAATYIPKDDKPGRIGLKSLAKSINELWNSPEKDKILNSANDIVNIIKETSTQKSENEFDKDMIDEAYASLVNRFDNEYGGFLPEPKFPAPHNLVFLLNYWNLNKKENYCQKIVKTTLDNMINGGIKDHIGFGYHRYSTDIYWLVPHFEKMLYDQATIILALIELFLVTNDVLYKEEAKRVIDYLFRDMIFKTGEKSKINSFAFYSAEDADSEGKEGEFYVWTLEEVKLILDEDEFELAKEIFNLSESGNFLEEHSKKKINKNIIHLKKSINQLSKEKELDIKELKAKIELIRKKMFERRIKRIKPIKDTKIQTDWNALAMVSLVRAGRYFDDELLIDSAKNLYNFLEKNLISEEGHVLHVFLENESKINGMIDDYAFLIWGLIEIYQADFDLYYLNKAKKLIDITIELFWDHENDNGFFFTSENSSDELFVRRKEIYDGALPSANSIMAMNILKLGRILSRIDYEEKALKIFNMASRNVNRVPTGHTALLSAELYYLNSKELIIVKSRNESEFYKISAQINSLYIPNTSILVLEEFSKDKNQMKLLKENKELNNYKTIDNKTTYFVCRNFSCEQPITELEKAIKILEEK